MARSVVLSTLVTRCQQRTDKENDTSITTSEWKSLISEAYAELVEIVASAGLRQYESTSSIIANGAASYAAPSDLLATVSIELLVDGTTTGHRRLLDEIMVQEIERWAGTTGPAQVYAVAGDLLYLYPNPSSGSYVWRYIPQPADLSSAIDATSVDCITSDGERFLIWAVAVKALAKSESDVQLAIMERDTAREALREWAVMRAFNAPRRRIVRDGDGTDGMSGSLDPADWWNR